MSTPSPLARRELPGHRCRPLYVMRTWSLLLGAASIILASCDGASPSRTPSPPVRPALMPRESGSPTSCPYPSVRPTYLRWVKPGDPVPSPRAYVYPPGNEVDAEGEETMASFLDWRNAELDSETAPYYVLLRRQTDPNLSA